MTTVSLASKKTAVSGERLHLESVLSEAQKAGFYGQQLESRLALGEIEMQMGNIGVGRARLGALEAEARAKGYGLIARKASVHAWRPVGR